MGKLITTKRIIESETFKVYIGTTNKKNPKTFYIEINGFIKLINKNASFDKDLIKNLSTAIKKMSVQIARDNRFGLDTITCINFSDDSLKNGKTSYLTVEMYFMQDSTNDFNDIYNTSVCIIDKFSVDLKKLLLENNIECSKNKK